MEDYVLGLLTGGAIILLLGLMAGTFETPPAIPERCVVEVSGAATCPDGTFIVTTENGEVIEVRVSDGG